MRFNSVVSMVSTFHPQTVPLGMTLSIRQAYLFAALAFLFSACASGTVVVQNDAKIKGPKVVALDAPLAPWVPQIENRLRQKGFQVKRFSRNELGALDNMGARYVLRISGEHHSGWKNRCIGGGYKFNELMAELVDLKTNEALAAVSGEGFSEDCPPLSGTIFGDIARMVADRWED
jgi:hypothetical protein